MANRHSHKKLRQEIRGRMATTGESYQKALHAIQRQSGCAGSGFDLIEAHYFGVPIVLATFEASEPVGRPVILRVPSARSPSGSLPPPPFLMFRWDGVQ